MTIIFRTRMHLLPDVLQSTQATRSHKSPSSLKLYAVRVPTRMVKIFRRP
jgi:hypothetical protein